MAFCLLTALLAAGCEGPSSPELQTESQTKLLLIPDHGVAPLPAATDGRSGESPTKTPPAYQLLKRYAKDHPTNPYVAVVGVWNPVRKHYEYSALPLAFSAGRSHPEAKPAYYRYQLADTTGRRLRTLAGLIPATSQAQATMRQWLQVNDRKLVVSVQHENSSMAGQPGKGGQPVMADAPSNNTCPDYVAFCGTLGEVTVTAPAPEPTTPPSGGVSGGGGWPNSGDNKGVPDPGHGAGGGGNGDDGSDGKGSFSGEITVDNSITRNDLTDCVYTKLNNTDKFTDLIANFEGGNSAFDLEFELTEINDNPFGNLAGTYPDFVAQIDASHLTTRTGLGVAGTFLHEAMHAEMRRYLRGQEKDGSTIPGFPGSFTEDWNNYVAEKYGMERDAIKYAEHQAMAKRFIDTIVDGLKDFDNGQIDRKYYEAVAWDGLISTKAWKENPNKEQIGRNRRDNAIDNRPNQCSR